MKRFYIALLSVLLLSVLSSCKNMPPEYYVNISIVESNGLSLNGVGSSSCHAVTSIGIEFQCKYFLTPLDSSIEIGDVEVISTDPDVIEIKNVDTSKHLITAVAKSVGQAKIRIFTENYHSATSVNIVVQ